MMAEFYKNLWEKKLPKLEALRQAQRTLLKQHGQYGLGGPVISLSGEISEKARSKILPLPAVYWAGFVLSGDWR
jgi:CHAT domain-containing protein